MQLTNNKTNQVPMTLPADLFEDLSSWFSSPSLAFSSWISAQPVSASTRKVRLSMWNKFTSWLVSQEVPLQECQSRHIQDFIKEHRLEKQHAWRYVKLIERVYFHLINLGLKVSNPGSIAGRAGVGNRQNDPMRVLSQKEKHKLDKLLFDFFDLAGEPGAVAKWKEEKNRKTKETQWSAVRDAAITAVLVGAGTKVGEVVGLSVNCTLDGFLLYPQKGPCSPRKAPLLSVAQRALDVWAPYRAETLNMGDVLFPAVISSRRDDHQVINARMHPATLFRRVRLILANAGITGSRASGQTLRNTYAAELIDCGLSDPELIEALGFQGEFSVQHLRQEYKLSLLSTPITSGPFNDD